MQIDVLFKNAIVFFVHMSFHKLEVDRMGEFVGRQPCEGVGLALTLRSNSPIR